MRRRKYIIAYDIVSNKRRRRIARLLESHGIRMNRSVFECTLDKKTLKELLKKLRKTIKKSEDSILLYHQCRICGSQAMIIGNQPPAETKTALITIE